MRPPKAPTISKLERISPTVYEAALKCLSRAAWTAQGDKDALPAHPRALLGIGVHALLEHLHPGRTGPDETGDELRQRAEETFDGTLETLLAGAHPLLRVKFSSARRLPFYNLYRARAVETVVAEAARRRPAGGEGATKPRRTRETALKSRDGRIIGRPDVLDASGATVIDYKTGAQDNPEQITDPELRQLLLYAFLAAENGTAITRGVIERADRTRAEASIDAGKAEQEAAQALAVLDDLNSHVGEPFSAGANPSPENCRFCPCIAFCDGFWEVAAVDWADACGIQIEGDVTSIDSAGPVISIGLHVRRGTCVPGDALVTRLPLEWVIADGSDAPEVGDRVRVTDARQVPDTSSPAVFRADRVGTAVWQVTPDI